MEHVDAKRFAQQAGNPALMLRIARAFLSQSPQWRAEFAHAAPHHDQRSALLHKMKGSCYAISATGAAQAFAQAEAVLHATDDQTQHLLTLVSEIEAELLALIDQLQTQVPAAPPA